MDSLDTLGRHAHQLKQHAITDTAVDRQSDLQFYHSTFNITRADSHDRAARRYIDSPAGVGLSYSTQPADYTTDDYQTTQDAYEAILQWFEKYPAFLSHDFYITGESYAGTPHPDQQQCWPGRCLC